MLTDPEIEQEFSKHFPKTRISAAWFSFARAIIAAHEAKQATAQAVPSGEVVAWMVHGNYTRQPFGMLSSAEAYMRGLLKSDPDGGYHIRPLRYATPAPAPAQEVGLTDADLLNWIERQHLEELSMGVVIDAPHDGEYYVNGDDGVTHYGKTLRAAIIAALRAKGGK